MKRILTLLALMGTVTGTMAQPATAVDESLSRHDFFYAGQSKQRRMFIVKDGQVSWSYKDQLNKGEISDAVLMSDGHILVAHQYGVAEVACDAVAMDIIIGEWPEFGSLNYCDEYLREAALIPNAPSGTVYKQQGKSLTKSLGLFEHWNSEHKYTKIDLKYKKL